MEKFTAKTLEDLLNKAAEAKGVKVEELVYFVTEEKSGFLGIGSSVTAEVYCMDDVTEFIFNYLGEFFTGIGVDIEIEILRDGDSFKVMLDAENNAILIGKNGQTLQSINAVVRAAANAEFKRRFRVLVDVNGYKESRYEKVKALAKRIAKTVQRTKVDASLDPMPNDERKAIHQVLADMPHIVTQSEGEGAARHLKIMYKDDKD